MGRDAAGRMFLLSFIGLERRAARGALRSLFLIPMHRRVPGGGIGFYLISLGQCLSCLLARVARGRYRLAALNVGMTMASGDMEGLVPRLGPLIDIS